MKDQQGQINGFDGAFLMTTWDKMTMFTTPRAAIEMILCHTSELHVEPWQHMDTGAVVSQQAPTRVQDGKPNNRFLQQRIPTHSTPAGVRQQGPPHNGSVNIT